MNSALAPYLERLLFAHDTVVIPGLGALVAQPASAAVDYAAGTVTPPTRSLSFNENLAMDDGLLVAAVVQERHCSEAEARDWIEQCVNEIQAHLGQREIVALANIGRLYKNYLQKIQFLPDAANFSRDSFGLPPIQFSPLSRSREVAPPPAQEVKEAPAPPPPAPRKRSSWPVWVLMLLLLALSGGGAYYLMQWRQQKQANNAAAPDSEAVRENVAPPGTDTPAETAPEKTPDPTTDTPKSAPAPKNKPATTERCTLVVGVFKDPANIARLKGIIAQGGFEVYGAPGKNGAEVIGAVADCSSAELLEQNRTRLRKLTGVSEVSVKK